MNGYSTEIHKKMDKYLLITLAAMIRCSESK